MIENVLKECQEEQRLSTFGFGNRQCVNMTNSLVTRYESDDSSVVVYTDAAPMEVSSNWGFVCQ